MSLLLYPLQLITAWTLITHIGSPLLGANHVEKTHWSYQNRKSVAATAYISCSWSTCVRCSVYNEPKVKFVCSSTQTKQEVTVLTLTHTHTHTQCNCTSAQHVLTVTGHTHLTDCHSMHQTQKWKLLLWINSNNSSGSFSFYIFLSSEISFVFFCKILS